MLVVFFNRSYWPDFGATGQLLTELSQDLAPRRDVEDEPDDVTDLSENRRANVASHAINPTR